MRADRERIISGVRNLGMTEGRGQVEAAIRTMVRDELSAIRGGRKKLGFGFSNEDIDEAVEEVEDIEAELLGEMYGIEVSGGWIRNQVMYWGMMSSG